MDSEETRIIITFYKFQCLHIRIKFYVPLPRGLFQPIKRFFQQAGLFSFRLYFKPQWLIHIHNFIKVTLYLATPLPSSKGMFFDPQEPSSAWLFGGEGAEIFWRLGATLKPVHTAKNSYYHKLSLFSALLLIMDKYFQVSGMSWKSNGRCNNTLSMGSLYFPPLPNGKWIRIHRWKFSI